MNLNKEKFLSLVSNEKVDTVQRNRERIRNREMYRVSINIALKVLNRMDELDWDNNRLSDELDLPMGEIEKIISKILYHDGINESLSQIEYSLFEDRVDNPFTIYKHNDRIPRNR